MWEKRNQRSLSRPRRISITTSWLAGSSSSSPSIAASTFSIARSICATTSAIASSYGWKPSLGFAAPLFAATVARRPSIGRPRATTRSAARSAHSWACATTSSMSSCTAMKFTPRTCQCACLPFTTSATSSCTTGVRYWATPAATSAWSPVLVVFGAVFVSVIRGHPSRSASVVFNATQPPAYFKEGKARLTGAAKACGCRGGTSDRRRGWSGRRRGAVERMTGIEPA